MSLIIVITSQLNGTSLINETKIANGTQYAKNISGAREIIQQTKNIQSMFCIWEDRAQSPALHDALSNPGNNF